MFSLDLSPFPQGWKCFFLQTKTFRAQPSADQKTSLTLFTLPPIYYINFFDRNALQYNCQNFVAFHVFLLHFAILKPFSIFFFRIRKLQNCCFILNNHIQFSGFFYAPSYSNALMSKLINGTASWTSSFAERRSLWSSIWCSNRIQGFYHPMYLLLKNVMPTLTRLVTCDGGSEASLNKQIGGWLAQ